MTVFRASGCVRITAIGVLLSAILVQNASACLCNKETQSPCNSLSTSGVIFLGTVKSIEDRPWSEFWSGFKQYSVQSVSSRYAMFRDEVIVKFSVQDVFKGLPAQELSVRITKSLGSCGFEYKPGELYFKKGSQYLVYANMVGADGPLRTTHCSNTTLASNAVEKIETYRRLRKLPQAVVMGTYSMQNDTDKKIAALGQTVTLLSDKGSRSVAEVQTDGGFSFTGLPPGAYRVAPAIAKRYAIKYGRGYRIQDGVPVNPETISVGTDSCAEVELLAFPDGKISGTVVDRHGNPLRDVRVSLWNADNVTGLDNWWWGDETNERGEFEKWPLLPGKYVVGVYIWTEQQRRHPYDHSMKPVLWFYPGVSTLQKAKIVTLRIAQHHSGVRIRVPTTAQ